MWYWEGWGEDVKRALCVIPLKHIIDKPFRTGHEALISPIICFNTITHNPHQPTPRLARTMGVRAASLVKFGRYFWSNLGWGGDWGTCESWWWSGGLRAVQPPRHRALPPAWIPDTKLLRRDTWRQSEPRRSSLQNLGPWFLVGQWCQLVYILVLHTPYNQSTLVAIH